MPGAGYPRPLAFGSRHAREGRATPVQLKRRREEARLGPAVPPLSVGKGLRIWSTTLLKNCSVSFFLFP